MVEVKNSNGYYADPVTLQPLSPETDRVVKCELINGKFIWPQVKFSNGSTGKIVYALFTAEEKQLYKMYRAGGSIKKVSQPVEKQLPVTQHIDTATAVYNISQNDVATSADTLAYIKACDTTIGTWFMDNTPHDLLTYSGSRSYRAIPRCLIPIEDRKRLNIE